MEYTEIVLAGLCALSAAIHGLHTPVVVQKILVAVTRLVLVREARIKGRRCPLARRGLLGLNTQHPSSNSRLK